MRHNGLNMSSGAFGMKDNEKVKSHAVDELTQCRRRVEKLELTARLKQAEEDARRSESLFQRKTVELDETTDPPDTPTARSNLFKS
jgi:hypothetical protein